MNSIMVIRPYLLGQQWVFDDVGRGLQAEALIAGMDTMLTQTVAQLGLTPGQFAIRFSAQEFPGYQQRLEWVEAGMGGNWYHSPEYGLDGWLCPALYKYFAGAPQVIYLEAVVE